MIYAIDIFVFMALAFIFYRSFKPKAVISEKRLALPPKAFSNLNLMKRKDRRIAMRRILKREGIKRPKYMSANALEQYWHDSKNLVLEEMRFNRKENI